MTIPLEPVATLAYFMFVASITPGPNNIMLAASAMNFGVWRTLPHFAGVVVGFSTMIFLVALGFGAIIEAFPEFQIMVSVLGTGYILYLAWRIANGGALGKSERKRPLYFHEGALFQLVNPKGWTMAMTTAGMFLLPLDDKVTSAFGTALTSIFTQGPATSFWIFFGLAMAQLFQNPRTKKIINTMLAIMLVACIPLMFLS